MRKPSTTRAAQLDREIAEVLGRPPGRAQHARLKAADPWHVVMDALLMHDPERAARIWQNLRQEYGHVNVTAPLLKVMHALPNEERGRFQAAVMSDVLPKSSLYALPAFYEMKKLASNFQLWFKALEETKKPGYKGLKVEWTVGDQKPSKVKQSSILRIDIDDGYYKRIDPGELPPEVFVRFEEGP